MNSCLAPSATSFVPTLPTPSYRHPATDATYRMLSTADKKEATYATHV
ncbi:hypothetical protein N9B43_06915 [Mariniblastus sp.]|nr:hypothetical protein [Mariniblastus sp.]